MIGAALICLACSERRNTEEKRWGATTMISLTLRRRDGHGHGPIPWDVPSLDVGLHVDRPGI